MMHRVPQESTARLRLDLLFSKVFHLKASLLFLLHNPCSWDPAKTNAAELPFGSNFSISSQAVRFMRLWDTVPSKELKGLCYEAFSKQTGLLARIYSTGNNPTLSRPGGDMTK